MKETYNLPMPDAVISCLNNLRDFDEAARETISAFNYVKVRERSTDIRKR